MSKTKAELEAQVEELVTEVNDTQVEIDNLETALETANANNAELTVALETAEANATDNPHDEEIPEHGSNPKQSKADRQAYMQNKAVNNPPPVSE